jgi:hypothetical protein
MGEVELRSEGKSSPPMEMTYPRPDGFGMRHGVRLISGTVLLQLMDQLPAPWGAALQGGLIGDALGVPHESLLLGN